ncbi:MAG TPA: FAD-linked oxidase C-terminal domain-containing protein, partial [Hyphomicrobiaceae bacterium]|nr:FAD-linked oxidase C-terminal domain-containing protein [Hyphomicrobiaceae bacterium]
EPAHHVELHGLLVTLQLFQARLAHAVLRADGTTEIGDNVVYDAIDVWAFLAEAGSIPVERAHGIVVNVAVADMAKRAMAHAWTSRCKGGISAEHGVGQSRLEELERYKQPVELDMMRSLKRALDPHGIMNPGKLLVR